MKKIIAVGLWALLFSLTPSGKAQTMSATFTFGGNSNGQGCVDNTSWNGDSTTYAQDMGAICFNQADPDSGPTNASYLDVPWQLGFPNNGFLDSCNGLSWGPKRYTTGDGTHTGDSYTESASTTCPYQSTPTQTVGFSFTATYSIVKHQSCRYGRCFTWYVSTLLGGSGTVTVR